jgi:hypothetical protein
MFCGVIFCQNVVLTKEPPLGLIISVSNPIFLVFKGIVVVVVVVPLGIGVILIVSGSTTPSFSL